MPRPLPKLMNRPVASALRAPLLTVLGMSMVINLALLAPSLFMLQVFDRIMTTRSIETLMMIGLITVLTLAMMGLLEYWRARTLSASGILLEQRMGPVILRRLCVPGGRDSTPEVAEGMRDLATVRGFLSGSGVVALCDAPWIAVYLGLIWLFHPSLGLLATVCTACLVLLAWLSERATRPVIGALSDSTRHSARLLDGASRNAETVAALGMSGAITRRWKHFAGANQRLMLQLSLRAGSLSSATRVGRQLIQVLMLGYGGYLVVSEHATPGVMLATTIILGRALAPVEQLIGGWKQIVETRLATGRLRHWVSLASAGERTELPRPSGSLTVDGVSYQPEGAEKPLVSGVTLELAPGQIMALIGPSGSGKTTLARLMVGAVAPTAGAVRLDGSDLRAWDSERLGAWIGYLPQDVALFDASVGENIARLGPLESDRVLQAAAQAHAHDLFVRLPGGYDTPVGDAGRRLSGGQRQRVALARAFFGDPPLVVLDEPDASLDSEGEQALLEALRDARSRGAAIVVVTQRRAVLSIADVVVVMKDGAIDRVASVEAPRVAAGTA